jgi:iron complex outermembrane recepter protein
MLSVINGRKRGRFLRILIITSSSLTLLPVALLAAGPSAAETAQPNEPTQLPRVVVTSPRPSGRSAGARPKRAPVARPLPAAPAAPPTAEKTPLNSNAVADSASLLGLPARQIPATVEVIDQETIRDRGYRTVTDAIQGAVGVTAGDFPAEPSSFSMRGLTSSQINTLYNGIKIGPQNMTSRAVDTFNLDRVEILKGPASLMSGEGAAGGAVNFVNKQPHTGQIINEALFSYDSFNAFRSGFGSGGGTAIKGLDYRFDISRSSLNGFIDDVNIKTLDISTQLNYRFNDSFKVWGALEYKKDNGSAYWGTPLVSANATGIVPTSGIVSGSHQSFNVAGNPSLGPVTIDRRTLTTNYNVLDNINRAEELWLRGGFEWVIAPNLVLRSQSYFYDADREWKNAENYAFNPGPGPDTGKVMRDRFYVAHDQRQFGNMTDLTWNTNINGMDNRAVFAVGASRLEFGRPGMAKFDPPDAVSLTDPVRSTFGSLETRLQTADIDNVYATFEDRLKITPTFALIGGIRVEEIDLDRDSRSIPGVSLPNFPFSKTWRPATGRIGFTWDLLPGLTWYGQVATAADVAANNIFLLGATQPLNLTRARTFETGLKQLSLDKRAEWSLAVFEIERKNVYSAAGGQQLNIAGKQISKGIEVAAAVRPLPGWNVWANLAYVEAHYDDFEFALQGGGTGSFSGHTPPNVPRLVVNAGTSYRLPTWLPVEVGATVRHVSDRYTSDLNDVRMLAYTVVDAYTFVDLDRSLLPAAWNVDKTRVTFRVRNLTDTKYAAWADPFYPDQILLGAPRSFEVSAAFKF